jgi:predicted small integral membrane protein
MLRTVKVFLVLTVALWALAGAFQNFANWGDTIGGVAVATSMTTFEGGAESWQATSNPIVIWVGAFFIVIAKIAAGVLCMIGAYKMWSARRGDSAAFSAAKELALVGCAIALLMLFGGFIVVAETWFEMWRSEALRSASLESAFRYGGMITMIALFVGMRDE